MHGDEHGCHPHSSFIGIGGHEKTSKEDSLIGKVFIVFLTLSCRSELCEELIFNKVSYAWHT